MSRRVRELSGVVFGKLTAIKRNGNNRHGDVLWICQCECGNKKIVPSRYLLSGDTKSCGCNRYRGAGKWPKGNREGTNNPYYKHGKSQTSLYHTYQNMKQRCYNKKVAEYHVYGGRGIKICDEWLNSFDAFYDWAIKSGYEKGLSIDRINNDGNYEPSNCQWLTRSENSRKIGIDRAKKKMELME